jgi:hypothetical protein
MNGLLGSIVRARKSMKLAIGEGLGIFVFAVLIVFTVLNWILV